MDFKIEAGKTYLDNHDNQVFIVGQTKEGLWLGQLGSCRYETFTVDGNGLLPSFKLVKEYKEPVVKVLTAYLWRNKKHGTTHITYAFLEDPNLELIASKTITLVEGEFR